MERRPAEAPRARPETALDAGFWLVVLLAGACLVLVAVTLLGSGTRPGPIGAGPSGGTMGASAAASPTGVPTAPGDLAGFLYPAPTPAPPLTLLDPDERPVDLAAMHGGLVLVFFGYTHCPDVCPATIGTVGTAMRDFGAGVRAVFVSVDPERDTPVWLREYVAYMPAGFTVVTGSATQVRSTADAWGVRYARVETGTPGAYTMSHTADVYLVDATGTLRAHFPFGTSPAAVTATLRLVGRSAGPSIGAGATPSAPATPGTSATPSSPSTGPSASAAVGGLRVEVSSSSVWAGGPAPLILALYGPAGRLDDLTVTPTVQLQKTDGSAVGGPAAAVAVRPPGVDAVSYVATLSIPSPGWWRIAVTAQPGALTLGGTTDVAALDQGASAPVGAAAPTIHSPTLDDVGGDARRVTTDPLPDLRLYRLSTSDALASGTPFVFVLDSTKFRVTPACGKAIVLARYLQDRWPSVPFIHHEPYRYSVVTDTAVLDGSLGDPPLTDVATAWGIGAAPWGAASMPWVFVVDGHGVVRAKYQGILGSDDVDVIVALIAQGG